MNPVDAQIAHFFSSLANHHWAIDSFLYSVADSSFLKGQVLMLVFWWLWFQPGGNENRKHRGALVATLVACVVGLAVGRFLVWVLPLRIRPIDNPVFHFQVPFAVGSWSDWSSFPSDHAILFFALASGFFYASRLVGLVTILYVSVVICFPRIYLGLHYVTDVLAGALMGAGLTCLLNAQKLRQNISEIALSFHDSRPQIFYVLLFLLTYQIASLFDPLRHLLQALHHSLS